MQKICLIKIFKSKMKCRMVCDCIISYRSISILKSNLHLILLYYIQISTVKYIIKLNDYLRISYTIAIDKLFWMIFYFCYSIRSLNIFWVFGVYY